MTTSKGGTAPATTSQPSQDEQQDCCMCGDFGLTSELFRCKICQLRSQHRYCSNTYPKAGSYRVCNWCLNENEDSAEKTQNSFNSSSSHKKATSEDDMIKTKKKSIGSNGHNFLQRSNSSIKYEKGSLKLNVNNHSIKKQKSPERSPLPLIAARKRITTGIAMQESLRRTKSEEISNSGMKKHVFKNRVKRYKLLDEVAN